MRNIIVDCIVLDCCDDGTTPSPATSGSDFFEIAFTFDGTTSVAQVQFAAMATLDAISGKR